jgi:hypothetical protein
VGYASFSKNPPPWSAVEGLYFKNLIKMPFLMFFWRDGPGASAGNSPFPETFQTQRNLLATPNNKCKMETSIANAATAAFP